MKIIIVGAGRIGASLSKSLAKENHEVYLVEQNEEKAARIDEKVDAKVIIGNGADPDLLKKLRVDQADLVLAVTTSDETNIVVCSLAATLGAQRRIARVRNTALSGMLNDSGYQLFSIDEIINPELVAAQDIVRTIQTPGTREVADFAGGKLLLRAFEIPESSPLCRQKLASLRDEDFPWPFLIIAISRNDKAMIPYGDTSIEAGDLVYALLPAASLGEFLTVVDPDVRKPKKIVIYGATITGEHVAKSLTDHVKDIILIEDNADKAGDIAGRLTATTVIHGSGSEADILTECGIEAADGFIATTSNDHTNLVSAVLAKKMGAKSTIIITQQQDYMSIVDALNIDVVINPYFVAVDQILRLVRGRGVSSVNKLWECDAEALELVPEAGSPITRAPIKDVKFPKNAIVGAISNGKGVALVKGDTHIKEGEKVIVFCQETAVKKVQSLFTSKKRFF